eukprot:CAMPEP_0205855322 /NCGR_PEP_ID=MMETSP1083-20121108/2544_1 /ASSEMBLY_ACC=CAM_ASM_000430 /TAXON_ID=97485 /ORGANISM="Prymnesium parvum, Strain Texoma1" /LENGTH=125 /DNA_ID=CAMNT_0053216691 /DNA_START=100 /DNA_END=477 /DNA_ORIENTATION=+
MSRPTSRLATALLCCTRAAAIDSAHSFYRSKFGWYAADNHSHALSRPLLAAPDKALYTPELDALFNDLDAIVEQHYVERHGGGRGEKVRLGGSGHDAQGGFHRALSSPDRFLLPARHRPMGAARV